MSNDPQIKLDSEDSINSNTENNEKQVWESDNYKKETKLSQDVNHLNYYVILDFQHNLWIFQTWSSD